MKDDWNFEFHLGSIPHATAAFVLQFSSEEIFVVMIFCQYYCLVPWIKKDSRSYFDFRKVSEGLRILRIRILILHLSVLQIRTMARCYKSFDSDSG